MGDSSDESVEEVVVQNTTNRRKTMTAFYGRKTGAAAKEQLDTPLEDDAPEKRYARTTTASPSASASAVRSITANRRASQMRSIMGKGRKEYSSSCAQANSSGEEDEIWRNRMKELAVQMTGVDVDEDDKQVVLIL